MRKQIATSAAAVGLVLTAVPAAAHAGTGSDHGWKPVTYQGFELPAGTVCPFGLKEDFPYQKVEERVVSTYPDGTPLETDFRGPMTARYVDEATGATTERDLGGTGQLYSLPDKSSVFVTQEHLGVTVPVGDPYQAAGEYVLSGPAVVTISPTHQKDFVYTTSVDDVCTDLAAQKS